MSRLLSLFSNTALAGIALVLLASPLIAGQLLGNFQSGTLGENTSAIEQNGGNPLSVVAEAKQFEPYVEFDPAPMIGATTYQTSVTFTSFNEQQAAYNGLLTMTNTSAKPITVHAETGTASGLLNNTRIWLSLTDTSSIASTLTTSATAANVDSISVAQATGFTSGSIVINDQAVAANATSSTSLKLAQPLAKAAPVGQKVYFGAAYFYNSQKPVAATTRSITLQPGQQATVDLVVATEKSDLDTHQLVIPLTIVGLQ